MADEKKKSKKAEKAEKAEKAPKEKKVKKGAEPPEQNPSGKKEAPGKEKQKEKKSHPALKAFLITCLVWFTLLLVFSALTFLNFFSLKEIVLQLLNPEEDFEVVFAYEIAMLNEFELSLDQFEAELDEREYELDDRESGLDEREYELEEREYELAEKYPWVSDGDTQEIENPFDISSVAKAVASMTPQRAARAMLGMDFDGALKVMNAMRPAEYGAILDNMPEDDAASFLDAMTASE